MTRLNIFIFLSFIFSVSCYHTRSIAAPVSRAVLARSVPTSWNLPHRVPAVKSSPKKRKVSQVKERGIQQQIPMQWCPEFFNKPPKLCSQCGGDSIVKGTCDKILLNGRQSSGCQLTSPYSGCYGYFCKCSDNGGADNSPKVTMTTVIDGKTGTAIWEPLTLSEYSRLRASTTVTLAETATSSGDSQIETVLAVVFAGGVTWWLAVQGGAAGAAAAIPPPSSRPEGSREDDQGCRKNPKEECPKCGGGDALGLCKSGTDAGCPCDEKMCPEKPPKCSVPDCGGDTNGNSKCSKQGSELSGCQCCPDKPPKCSVKDCEGDDQNKCTQDKYKGCSCKLPSEDVETDFAPDTPPLDNKKDQSSAAADVFTRIWKGDYKKLPGYKSDPPKDQTPWCIHGAAPKQPREPKEYCQCGKNHATLYSVAQGNKTPCPWSPSSTGKLVKFSTPAPSPKPTPPQTEKPKETKKPCQHGWCAAPVCYPECGPS